MDQQSGKVLHSFDELDPQGIATAAEGWSSRAAKAGTALWEVSRATYDRIADSAVAGAHATDRAIRARPYQAVGIAVGIGFLVGALLNRRH
jgi:ElaB/YqjD/DUF883 family membrane-anchored ribosome-binding protein